MGFEPTTYRFLVGILFRWDTEASGYVQGDGITRERGDLPGGKTSLDVT